MIGVYKKIFCNDSPQTPMNKNTPCNISSQYQNYKNISEVPHKHIYQIDSNSFFIRTSADRCEMTFPFIFFIIGICILVGYFIFIITVIKSFWNFSILAIYHPICFLCCWKRNFFYNLS